ncbi:MAG: Fic family protein [Blastocatellales bacterium]|nr:Fic family protein [Blastocatellales bacterium]
MMTLRQLAEQPETIPMATSWLLADLGEARGRQELFTRQSPQKLKILREHALIESAISSNRIEGVTVEHSRIAEVVLGKAKLRDRDEAEVRGYRDALTLIHDQTTGLPISEDTILRLHRLSHVGAGDAGQYKEHDSHIIEKRPDGRVRVRFKTVAAAQTPAFTRQMFLLWRECLHQRLAPPLIAMAAMNLDFLCIHPFRDGNGRTSRLLMLLQSYHFGYEAGRYISLERLIEEHKARYYETLEQSSHRWHEGRHDPWPYTNFLLFILLRACREFEERIGKLDSPKGAKAEMVLNAIRKQRGEFRLVDIERACPGVGREWIRTLMVEMKKSGELTCRGRGPGARWSFLWWKQ